MEVNEKLLSKEKDLEFKRIKGLTWLPWVGTNYFQLDHRILIIAESHYQTPGESIEKDDSITRKVVQIYAIPRDKPAAMFENLYRCLFATNDINRELLWSNIAFYNFVQRPMPTIKSRPNEQDFHMGWKVFVDIVKNLKPTECIFVGVEATKFFNDNMYKLGIPYNSVQRLKLENLRRYARQFSIVLNDTTIPCVAIQHTSHHFSWKSWNVFLQKGYNEILKDLQK